MKYIEKDGNVEREYLVKIDDVELERILKELNEKCTIAKKTIINVTGYDIDEAISKINSINKDKINIVNQRNLNEIYSDQPKYSKNQYLFECEYYCNKQVYLAYIIDRILENYREDRFAVTKDTESIEHLLDYANCIELVPYQERFAKYGITKDLYEEYENNMNYDFALLNELYQKVLACFKLVLVKEKVTTEFDDNTKVYKLGSR